MIFYKYFHLPVEGTNGITINSPDGICIAIPPEDPNSLSIEENGFTDFGGVGGNGKS
jgi:hypothetical protein